jgi:hypothetical protein
MSALNTVFPDRKRKEKTLTSTVIQISYSKPLRGYLLYDMKRMVGKNMMKYSDDHVGLKFFWFL